MRAYGYKETNKFLHVACLKSRKKHTKKYKEGLRAIVKAGKSGERLRAKREIEKEKASTALLR